MCPDFLQQLQTQSAWGRGLAPARPVHLGAMEAFWGEHPRSPLTTGCPLSWMQPPAPLPLVVRRLQHLGGSVAALLRLRYPALGRPHSPLLPLLRGLALPLPPCPALAPPPLRLLLQVAAGVVEVEGWRPAVAGVEVAVVGLGWQECECVS